MHSDRPGVFYKDPSTGQISPQKVCFGIDVLVKAGVKETQDKKKVILDQDEHGNCIVRLANEDEQGLPAGSYTIRHNITAMLFRLYVLQYIPHTRKTKLNFARLASIVLPIVRFAKTGKEYLLLTQRVHKKSGSYNDIWVFPGGHVERGETFAEAAARETREETGLNIPEESLQSLCCWQEFLVNKKHQVQFLICVFSGVYEVEDEVDEEAFLNNLKLQEQEVASAVLMPKGVWDQMSQKAAKKHETSHYSHKTSDILWDSDDSLETVTGLSKRKKKQGYDIASFNVDDVCGNKHSSYKFGVHGPHKFGIRMLIKALQKDVTSLIRRNP